VDKLAGSGYSEPSLWLMCVKRTDRIISAATRLSFEWLWAWKKISSKLPSPFDRCNASDWAKGATPDDAAFRLTERTGSPEALS